MYKKRSCFQSRIFLFSINFLNYLGRRFCNSKALKKWLIAVFKSSNSMECLVQPAREQMDTLPPSKWCWSTCGA